MFTLADHLFQMDTLLTAEDPFLEGYTSMGFLAGQTETIALTMLVTGVTYRYPGALAKTVTTLDVLSQGRSVLGIGAAWYDGEHAGLGITFPPIGQRFEMMEETLQICEQMWSDNNGPFEGKHYRLAETLCVPKPIQQPRPPILIGGAGEPLAGLVNNAGILRGGPLEFVPIDTLSANRYAQTPPSFLHRIGARTHDICSPGRDTRGQPLSTTKTRLRLDAAVSVLPGRGWECPSG